MLWNRHKQAPHQQKPLYWVWKNRTPRLEEKQCSFKIQKFNSQKPLVGGQTSAEPKQKTLLLPGLTPVTDLLPAKALVPVYVKLYGILSSRIL